MKLDFTEKRGKKYSVCVVSSLQSLHFGVTDQTGASEIIHNSDQKLFNIFSQGFVSLFKVKRSLA